MPDTHNQFCVAYACLVSEQLRLFSPLLVISTVVVMCVTWRVHSAQVDVWGLRWPHRAEASHANTSATPRPQPATRKKGASVMQSSASLILTCTALLTCYFSWSGSRTLSGRHPRGTARLRCAMCTGRCSRGGRVQRRVVAASSPVEWSASIGRTRKPSPTSTAPGNGALLPGNTATSLPVAVSLLKHLVINQSVSTVRGMFALQSIHGLLGKIYALSKSKLSQRPKRTGSRSQGFFF